MNPILVSGKLCCAQRARALCAGFFLLIAPFSYAQIFWDADGSAIGNSTAGANLGGSGSWNTTLGNWWNGLAPATNPWPNLATNTAVFSGTAGTVTINTGASGVQAGGLRFESGNYVLAGATPAEALTLGGPLPTITVTKPGTYAKISATLAGSNGLTLAGPGTLTLTGANTYTGGTTISSGTLNVWHDSNLGAPGAPVILASGILQLGSTRLDRLITVSNASRIDVSLPSGGGVAAIREFQGVATLTKTGFGTVRSAEANDSFTGILNVEQGIFQLLNRADVDALHNQRGSARNAAGYVVQNGAILSANGANTSNPVRDSFSDTAPVTLSGGTLQLLGTALDFPQRETAGDLIVQRSLSRVNPIRFAQNDFVLDLRSITHQLGGPSPLRHTMAPPKQELSVLRAAARA